MYTRIKDLHLIIVPAAGLLALALFACAPESPAGPAVGRALPGGQLPALPRPTSNNAVAALQLGERQLLFSFLGLGAGKTWRDTRSDAWMLELPAGTGMRTGEPEKAIVAWNRLPDVPGPGGRLAATAAVVDGNVYVFGGYTVAGNREEKSVPLLHRLDPVTRDYTELTPMPVPVDDTVALVYANRYVYLVSGWHDTDNVDLVQVYDTREDMWQQATPFPGPPVFGHAGGISGRRMVICDGVKVVPAAAGKRSFESSPECYLGTIDAGQPEVIAWQAVAHHSGVALYRMAATGTRDGLILFAGGSDNPYNFNGIGYDGKPSSPSDRVFAYHPGNGRWQALGKLATPSMDHRGLLEVGDSFVLVGGMGEAQQVLQSVRFFYLDPRP